MSSLATAHTCLDLVSDSVFCHLLLRILQRYFHQAGSLKLVLQVFSVLSMAAEASSAVDARGVEGGLGRNNEEGKVVNSARNHARSNQSVAITKRIVVRTASRSGFHLSSSGYVFAPRKEEMCW